MKKLRALLATAALLSPFAAMAAESPLIGTWQLQTYTREAIPSGKRSEEYGASPHGFISYAPDGRMYAIFGPGNRPKPAGLAATDKEIIDLYRTIVSYAGTYTLEGEGKVVHHVDISWNQTFTGTEQVRFYKLVGDVLTITTPSFGNAAQGTEARYILVWKKVR